MGKNRRVIKSLKFVSILMVVFVSMTMLIHAILPSQIDDEHAHGHDVTFGATNDYANGVITDALGTYFAGSDEEDITTTNLVVSTDILRHVSGFVYGGGDSKNVTTTNILINGPWNDTWIDDETGVLQSGYWIYGGGVCSNVETSNITFDSGFVRGYILGGGNGESCAQTSGTTKDTNITMNGGYIGLISRGTSDKGHGEIYGGGIGGSKVTGNTNVTINGGTVEQHILGGGLGENSDVMGNANVLITGGTIGGSVTGGGGNKRNTVHGDTFVKITGGNFGQVAGSGINPSHITGGGYWNTNYVAGIANVLIELDSPDEKINADIYGGGGIRLDSTLYPTRGVSGAFINLKTGIVEGSVWAGGKNSAPVENTTTVKLNGEVVIKKNIYGGGASGGSTVKDTVILLENGIVEGSVQGAGGALNISTNSTLNNALIKVFEGAKVKGNIIASSEHAKVTVGNEARVVFQDMDEEEGFLTDYSGKTIIAGTALKTVMEFNNFTTSNTTIIGKTADWFNHIEFKDGTNTILVNTLSNYFGEHWLIDDSSKVSVFTEEVIDALSVTNEGTIQLDSNNTVFNTLNMTGEYIGVEGNLLLESQKVDFTDYLNIAETATGHTSLLLNLSEYTWNGRQLDLIEAALDGSLTDAFTMEPFYYLGDDIEGTVVLKNREAGDRIIWYIELIKIPTVTLNGQKNVIGANAPTETFNFIAREVDENGSFINSTEFTANVNGSGTFIINLGTLSDGIHYFTIIERDDKALGWKYDDTKHEVIVTISFNETNIEYETNIQGDSFIFSNEYKKDNEPDTSVTLDNNLLYMLVTVCSLVVLVALLRKKKHTR